MFIKNFVALQRADFKIMLFEGFVVFGDFALEKRGLRNLKSLFFLLKSRLGPERKIRLWSSFWQVGAFQYFVVSVIVIKYSYYTYIIIIAIII